MPSTATSSAARTVVSTPATPTISNTASRPAPDRRTPPLHPNPPPVELAWSQDFPSRHEALTAERQIKGWTAHKETGPDRNDWTSLKEAAITRTRNVPFDFAQGERKIELCPSPYPSPRHRLGPPAARREYRQGRARHVEFRAGRDAARHPARRWPNPQAGPRIGADIVLEQAKVMRASPTRSPDCRAGLCDHGAQARRDQAGRDPGRAAREIHTDTVRAGLPLLGRSARGWKPTTSPSRAQDRDRADQTGIRQPEPGPGGDPDRL